MALNVSISGQVVVERNPTSLLTVRFYSTRQYATVLTVRDSTRQYAQV
ncbi:MAG: hypothetical protein F6J90_29770 [Moorea sp. SIOASIH]|nr:hypothetical protein [Moorena sp. SIOASIH]NEO40307.1 hypothetical protein [Moorena sp. SIOASIH]